jgi:catechol 2,3-dioxygenase-like lactoylglutathione lyase family enzyme
MQFTHVSIVAKDANKVANFYRDVFGCEDRCERSGLPSEWVNGPMGLSDGEITLGAWLSLPGVEGPFLEIFQFRKFEECPPTPANLMGIRHISFDVDDLEAVFEAVIAAGGSEIGEITQFDNGQDKFADVFMRDPEGNILDLKQRM